MTTFSIDYLRGAAVRPDIQTLKRYSYEVMRIHPGARVLDVGCGPGIDSVELAHHVGPTGHVFGIDTDPDMIAAADAEAAAAGVADRTRHLVSSCLTTPFETASFDACRCERLHQHLSPHDAMRSVAEARRVLRPGAIMVLVDTDWATLSIHSGDNDLERRLAQLRQATLPNPFAARAMPELLALNGFQGLHTQTIPIRLSTPRIDALLADLAPPGRWTRWRDELARAEQRGTLYASLCMITCSGNVPV